MKENLVEVVKKKGTKVGFSVSSEIGNLTFETMTNLRSALCLAIAEVESVWRDNQ